MTKVFVLGSGFSRAISGNMPEEKKMPTLVELSTAVLGELRAKDRGSLPGQDTPLKNDFEQWLNYLIESPPWLTPSEQLRNRAAFIDVSKALPDVLARCQRATVEETGFPPDWLKKLVDYWDKQHAVVITFNYDQLVELAWHAARTSSDDTKDLDPVLTNTDSDDATDLDPVLTNTDSDDATDLDPVLTDTDSDDTTDLYPVPIVAIETRDGGAREGRRGLFRIGRTSHNGMRLLKLHGSLGWHYSGMDGPPNDTIYDLGVRGPNWDADGLRPVGAERAELLTTDLVPMIVPPAAIKSPYYANRTLQALWRIAAESLREAKELVIMGFSLPQSDSLVGSLLSTNFHLGNDSKIVPVDYSRGILDRVRATFGPERASKQLDGDFAGLKDQAIPKWVDKYAP